MKNLICELKEEHEEIESMLDKVKEEGFRTEHGRADLDQARDALLAHLGKEDRVVYPALRKKAEADTRLQKILKAFSRDMNDITRFVWDFFERFPYEGQEMDFASDFGRLVGMLQNRISREEKVIYEEYQRLFN